MGDPDAAFADAAFAEDALLEQEVDEAFDSDPLPSEALPALAGRRRGRGRRLAPKDTARPLVVSAEQRLLILDTWQRSGLPAGDFAPLVGMSKHTLYGWKKRFDAEGPGGLMDQPRGGRRGSHLPELTRRTILMPNHWHFVVWPEDDEQLTAFLRWLTLTHTQRWHAHYHTAGTGHLYQGRYRAFPVQEDDHLYTLFRYVERNALRANLVKRAEDWRWSSLAHRRGGDGDAIRALLHPWPLPEPADWLKRVNRAETAAELEALRRSVLRGQPFGTTAWQKRTAKKLALEYTFRRQGRPRKTANWRLKRSASPFLFITGRPTHGSKSWHDPIGTRLAKALEGIHGKGNVRWNQGLVNPNGVSVHGKRPDIQYISGGKTYIIELQSPGQSAKYMRDMKGVYQSLLGSYFGGYDWLPHP